MIITASYLTLNYLLSIVSYLLLLLVFHSRPTVRILLPAAGAVLCFVYGYFSPEPMLIVVSLLSLFCAFFSLRGPVMQNIRIFSLVFLLNECVSGIWGCILIMLNANTSAVFQGDAAEYVLSILTYCLILIFNIFRRQRYTDDSKTILSERRIRLSYYAVILMAVSLAVTVSLLKHLLTRVSSGFIWNFTIVIILLSYFGIGGVAMMFNFTISSNRRMKEMLQQEQMTSEIMRSYNLSLQEQDNLVRTYRHDINNHLLSLQHLIAMNDISSAKEYISSMFTALADTKVSVTPSGNTLVDAISNYYMGLLPDKTIFHIQAALPEVLPVDSYSFTTIYANLLQNAVEAVLSQTSQIVPSISATLKLTENFLHVVIENTYSENASKRYIQGAQSEKNHGFGLNNVKSTVSALNGTISIDKDSNCFKVSVALPAMSSHAHV